MMMMNAMQANKCENSDASASVQLQATTGLCAIQDCNNTVSTESDSLILTITHENSGEKKSGRKEQKFQNSGTVILVRIAITNENECGR